jgi:hypothetical protein
MSISLSAFVMPFFGNGFESVLHWNGTQLFVGLCRQLIVLRLEIYVFL